ncbi:MAG: hypothetical protein V3W45_03055, partial [Sedimentisphaerales bacterium]
QDPKKYIDLVLDPVIVPLHGFDQLRILVHADNVSLKERKRRKKNWKSTIGNWRNKTKTKIPTEVFYDVYGTPTGCCEDWFKNMWLAYQDKQLDKIIYLPFDIAFMAPAGKAHKGLQDFVDMAKQSDIDLLLGTYEAETDTTGAPDDTFLIGTANAGSAPRKDIRKNLLEEFAIVELWSAFPRTMLEFCRQRSDAIHKPVPRTGFFALSRRLYEAFIGRPWRSTMLPWAGTVQLLLCAFILTRKGVASYRVTEQFVGKLKQGPESFAQYGHAHQRERIAFVLADERHYWSRLFPGLEL